MTASPSRLLSLVALTGVAAVLTACGGGSKPAAAPGSPEKPLVAQQTRLGGAASDTRVNEAGGAGSQTQPGYQKLVQSQSRHPRSRFTPCNLVSVAQARAIVGAPMQQPLEASQGPTCIYRTKDGKSFVTIAVQSLDFKKLKPRIHLRQRVAVSDRAAYCGIYGQPMLYVPLSGGRVLSVGAHCSVARRFAVKAVQQLAD
jgi:hypothetical protein